jgi:uncharacterized membrane protein
MNYNIIAFGIYLIGTLLFGYITYKQVQIYMVGKNKKISLMMIIIPLILLVQQLFKLIVSVHYLMNVQTGVFKTMKWFVQGLVIIAGILWVKLFISIRVSPIERKETSTRIKR